MFATEHPAAGARDCPVIDAGAFILIGRKVRDLFGRQTAR